MLKEFMLVLLQIRIRFSECLVADSIETEVTGTTGYGVPDSVTSARVENNSDSTCIVFWNHNKPSTEKMQYQVRTRGGAQFFLGNHVKEIYHTRRGFLRRVCTEAADSCRVSP